MVAAPSRNKLYVERKVLIRHIAIFNSVFEKCRSRIQQDISEERGESNRGHIENEIFSISNSEL